MPGSAKSLNGTLIRRPAVLSGWTLPRGLIGILGKKSEVTQIWIDLGFLKMNGYAVVMYAGGCRGDMRAGLSTRSKLGAALVCRSRGSASTIFASITKRLAIPFTKGFFRLDA